MTTSIIDSISLGINFAKPPLDPFAEPFVPDSIQPERERGLTQRERGSGRRSFLPRAGVDGGLFEEVLDYDLCRYFQSPHVSYQAGTREGDEVYWVYGPRFLTKREKLYLRDSAIWWGDEKQRRCLSGISLEHQKPYGESGAEQRAYWKLVSGTPPDQQKSVQEPEANLGAHSAPQIQVTFQAQESCSTQLGNLHDSQGPNIIQSPSGALSQVTVPIEPNSILAGQIQDDQAKSVDGQSDSTDHEYEVVASAPENEPPLPDSQMTATGSIIENLASRFASLRTGFKQLDQRYSVIKQPQRFFRVGRVFMTLWSEPLGYNTQNEGSVSENSNGEKVFSEIRRFIVVRESARCSICCALQTYQKRGTTKPGIRLEDHALVYAADEPPPELLPHEKESRPSLFPIVIEDKFVTIDELSRLNFGRVYTVEYNLKVRNIGRIQKDSLEELKLSFLRCMGGATTQPG